MLEGCAQMDTDADDVALPTSLLPALRGLHGRGGRAPTAGDAVSSPQRTQSAPLGGGGVVERRRVDALPEQRSSGAALLRAAAAPEGSGAGALRAASARDACAQRAREKDAAPAAEPAAQQWMPNVHGSGDGAELICVGSAEACGELVDVWIMSVADLDADSAGDGSDDGLDDDSFDDNSDFSGEDPADVSEDTPSAPDVTRAAACADVAVKCAAAAAERPASAVERSGAAAERPACELRAAAEDAACEAHSTMDADAEAEPLSAKADDFMEKYLTPKPTNEPDMVRALSRCSLFVPF